MLLAGISLIKQRFPINDFGNDGFFNILMLQVSSTRVVRNQEMLCKQQGSGFKAPLYLFFIIKVMKKVIIFGNSGSGKSTLAKEYIVKYGLSH